ncbi:RTT109 [Candida pseudojiufengensis]|uniref:RTT109 n=1 Tax=Candida pseudojiufengensis TaxID=497109 RepID=UPI002225A26E|nr:RTT109 [Candida pseudojiufengensis]KAI5963469.1 RTT109 [Candida pseudojiufengensis]
MSNTSLSTKLSNVLPKNSKFKYLYIQSNPIYIKSPIHQLPKLKNLSNTLKIRHFFILIENDIIILGIEIFIYLQIFDNYIDQFIFVSKCDTVGLKEINFKIGDVVREVLDFIINYDINKYQIKVKKEKQRKDTDDEPIYNGSNETNGTLLLLNKLINNLKQNPSTFNQLPYYNKNRSNSKQQSPKTLLKLPNTINLKLCIFTKTAPQYIFPNSSKNKLKHKINGQILLNWWLKIVNSITLNWTTKKLIIPGSDNQSILNFIKPFNNNWSIGHIFDNHNQNDLAIYSIPLFPDDPKGRFLEHLIIENRYSNMNISQFYKELGYRQEFRIGDCVGLIGCEFKNYIFDNNTTTTEDKEDDIIKVTVSQYKQFINLLKNINYNIEIDINYMIENEIPNFFINQLGFRDFEYGEVIGSKEVDNSNSKTQDLGQKRIQTNDLTGLIKRKKK